MVRNCSKCKVKLGILGGKEVNDKLYCASCFKKIEKNTDEKKGKDKKQKLAEAIPNEVKGHLSRNERIHYFSYISYKGGCLGSSPRDEYWIAMTDKKVLYRTKIILENKTLVEKNGIIPFKQISFIEISKVTTQGCSGTNCYELAISSSGGTIKIPVPTEEKGFEIRKAYVNISGKKFGKKNAK